MLVLFFAAVLLMSVSSQNSPFSEESRFVLTTRPRIDLPANLTLKDRAFVLWLQFQKRFGKPRPMAHSFPASATNRCSIHGLLNQCTEVTGVRYAIARDVAAGTVQFGHTNTLNGTQWVMAFAEALLTGQPEWWDFRTKRFRKENLVLLTNDARRVLVLPKEMVREFQGRGAD